MLAFHPRRERETPPRERFSRRLPGLTLPARNATIENELTALPSDAR